MNNHKILIVGVGGQGTLLASRVLGNVVIKKGYDVKVSEVHGMAQRGGSVVTYVNFGKKMHSPIVEKGEADIIVAFEQMEALRWSEYLKPDGEFIVNEQKIDPMPVIAGDAKYPNNILEKLNIKFKDFISLDALKIAKECGNIKAVNMVLLGVMAKKLDIEKEDWINAITELLPEKLVPVNIQAFERGYNFSSAN